MKRSGGQRSSGRVIWDEANLNYLEVNKTPKRKITEPKTPYHAPDIENGNGSPGLEGAVNMDNAAHAKAVWNALTEVASTSGGQSSRREWWTPSEDEMDELDCDPEYTGSEQSGHRLSFIEQRKAHYDEYRTMRTLRQQGSIMNEGEDDNSKQKGPNQEMIVDGMDSMELQDMSP